MGKPEDNQRRISELEAEMQRLRKRIEQMLSRKGGRVEGQVHLEGWLQFESQSQATDPSGGSVRLQVITTGSKLQLVAIYPSGLTEIISQG